MGRVRPVRSDEGGVWIVTGVVLGSLLYAGIVLMAMAGFTAVVPLVVVPPVVVGLIGASNLLGGGRNHGQPGALDPGRAPPSSSGPNGPRQPAATVRRPPEAGGGEPAGPA